MTETLSRSTPELTIPIEFDPATKEALKKRGLTYLKLGRSVDEILTKIPMSPSREADDFIYSPHLFNRKATDSEVFVFPTISKWGQTDGSFYKLEDEMRSQVFEFTKDLKPEERGFYARVGEFADMLDAVVKLRQATGEDLDRYAWTNTRVFDDNFLTIWQGKEGFYIDTARASSYTNCIVPLLFPAKIYPNKNAQAFG